MFKKISILLFLVISLLLSACGRQASIGDDTVSSSIIVGDLDWKEVTSLSASSPIRQNSGAIADLDLPAMGSRCTGFMITEDILMTNQHCIPAASYARGVTAQFKHEAGVKKADMESFDCSTFIGNHSELDFALLKCQGSPGAKYGFVQLSDKVATKNLPIYVIQQNCDYYSVADCDWTKKYSVGSLLKIEAEYTHNADTLGGSSGSPVFSGSDNQVIGLHHAGYGNNGMGRGYENYAVPMYKIVPVLKSQFGLFASTGGSSGGSRKFLDGGKSQASALSLNAGSFDAEIEDSSADYFKVSLTKTTAVKVSIKFSHASGDLDLVVTNSQSQKIKVSEGTTDSESVSLTLSKGTYYIKVYGYAGATGKYAIDLVK